MTEYYPVNSMSIHRVKTERKMEVKSNRKEPQLVCTSCDPSLGKPPPEAGKNQREICKTEKHFGIGLDVTLSPGQENKASSKRKLWTWHFVSHGQKHRAAGEKENRLAEAVSAHGALPACTAHLPQCRHQLPDRRLAARECVSLKKDRRAQMV